MQRCRQGMLRIGLVLAGLGLPAHASDLRYDAQSVQQQEITRQLIWQTRDCMAGAIQSMLQLGSRDSEQILNFASKTCGNALHGHMTERLGRAPAEVNSIIRSMAVSELNRVPGLSRVVPEAGKSAKPLKGLEGTERELTQCLLPEVQYGEYSSYDEGKSAMRLLTQKCPRQWMAWMSACRKRGDSEDNCIAKSAIIAQTALKLYGK